MNRLQIVVLAFVHIVFAADAVAQPGNDFRPLFNGKNLDGWQRVNTAESTWSVKDGMLICSGKPIGELRTKRMYQNFVMEVEWRHMKPRGNAGIFVWADDITARGVPFHRSIEVQVLENAYGNNRSHTTHGDIFPIHGATMIPINGRGGSRAFPTEMRSKPSPQWNHYRIECRDGEIALAVNGKIVTRGKECSPRKGYVCIESEGGVVHYRNMRIKVLPNTEVESKHVAIADRGYKCLYEGINLDGWHVTGDGWKARDWILAHDSGDEGSIATNQTFGDFGAVIDFRFRGEESNATIDLRGASFAARDLKPHLVSGWNRIETELADDRLTVRANGKDVYSNKRIENATEKGPIKIVSRGPVDFANIYFRPIGE